MSVIHVMKAARHWFWIAPIVLGLAFIGGGAYMMIEGRSAHDEVKAALISENVTTSADASIPGVPVDSAATAKSQSDAIEHHTITATGGETFSTLDRYLAADGTNTTNDATAALVGSNGKPVANPLRDTAFQSAALRTSLNVAVMGFKVSDLVVGLGLFLIVMGGTLILFLAPAVYWAAEVAKEHEKPVVQKTAPKIGGLSA